MEHFNGMDDVEVVSPDSALSLGERAQIDIQIATARAFPRSIAKVREEVLELATVDEATAESMFYALPRFDKRSGETKSIEGPSVRFSEIVVYSWGNIRQESHVESIGDTHVTAVSTVIDLERNIAVRSTVRRGILTASGIRYGEDMINTTCNAACAIAGRNAVFKVVPMAVVRPIYERALLVAAGKSGSYAKNRDTVIRKLFGAGVPQERILAYFGYSSVEQIRMEDLILLKGAFTAIREGMLTAEGAFVTDRQSRAKSAEVRQAATDNQKGPGQAPAGPGYAS